MHLAVEILHQPFGPVDQLRPAHATVAQHLANLHTATLNEVRPLRARLAGKLPRLMRLAARSNDNKESVMGCEHLVLDFVRDHTGVRHLHSKSVATGRRPNYPWAPFGSWLILFILIGILGIGSVWLP